MPHHGGRHPSGACRCKDRVCDENLYQGSRGPGVEESCANAASSAPTLSCNTMISARNASISTSASAGCSAIGRSGTPPVYPRSLAAWWTLTHRATSHLNSYPISLPGAGPNRPNSSPSWLPTLTPGGLGEQSPSRSKKFVE